MVFDCRMANDQAAHIDDSCMCALGVAMAVTGAEVHGDFPPARCPVVSTGTNLLEENPPHPHRTIPSSPSIIT